jgi:hypothetical protein
MNEEKRKGEEVQERRNCKMTGKKEVRKKERRIE